MKKIIILNLFLLGILGFTACGGNATTQQLETEKAEAQAKFESMTSEVARLEGEEKQLLALVNPLKDNEQISLLMKQYTSINNSLTGAMRRYNAAVNQYNTLIESNNSGTTTKEELEAASIALQEKLDKVTKKADMTVSELGRMKLEIEEAVKKATTQG